MLIESGNTITLTCLAPSLVVYKVCVLGVHFGKVLGWRSVLPPQFA